MLLDESELSEWDSPVEFDVKLAGGISTLRAGFQIAWIKSRSPALCFLLTPEGNAFARFNKDRTIRISDGGCDRAELEAVQGMQRLVLGWEG